MTGSTLLGRSLAVRVFFFISIVVTLGIAYWILQLRTGVFDPEAITAFYRLFFFDDYSAAFFLVAVLLIGLVPGIRTVGWTVVSYCGRHPVVVALVSTFAFALMARFVYFAHPLSMDEYAAVFQSKAFAAGKLTGQFPVAQLDWLIPPGFQGMFLSVSKETGAVASTYWPGFAVLLTPFTLLGVPWLCNPALGGLTVLAAHRLAMDLFDDEQAAGMMVLLVCASTAVAFNSISFYSMSSHLLCNVVFAVCLLRKTIPFALLAGMVGGLALSLHNPVPHALFALPWIIWLVCQTNKWRLLAALAVGYVPLVLLIGFGWAQVLNGLRPPSADAAAVAQGAGANGLSAMLEWVLRRVQAAFTLPSTHVLFVRSIGLAKVWLWAAPGLMLLAIYGAWTQRANHRVMLFAWSALTTLVGFLFFPADQGHGWGFRYFHSAWIALPVLAVAALWAKRSAKAGDENQHKADLAQYVAGSAVIALVLMTGIRAYQVRDYVGAHLAQMPEASIGQPKVKFVSFGMGYYVQDLVQSDPFLRTRPLVMFSHGRKNDNEFMAVHYPDLQVLDRSYRGSVWGTAEAKVGQ